MSHFHLAQLNIAKAKDELTSIVMKGFVDRLNEINALADDSLGLSGGYKRKKVTLRHLKYLMTQVLY